MTDQTAHLLGHDPFDDDTPWSDDILMFHDNPILDLSEPQLSQEPNFFNPSKSHSTDNLRNGDTNNPTVDPFFWDMYNQSMEGHPPGPSEVPNETNNQQEDFQPPNSEFGEPVQLSTWPVNPIPYSCTCCQVLREIIHTNGINVTKLEIHGRLGLICHAILENQCGAEGTIINPKYQMFDFCKKSIENVKQFLFQYCEDRRQAGYVMLQDPLFMFYEALSVGLYGFENLDADDFLQTSPVDLGDCQMIQQQPKDVPQPNNDEVRLPKTSLAAQRERTGKLKLRDFRQYFHLPIDDAAKKMNVCPTVMKKICRRHGLSRWPYRKIKSIERKISAKRASLNATDTEERAQAQTDIESLQQELANIYAGFGD